jgi:hypothetical protein
VEDLIIGVEMERSMIGEAAVGEEMNLGVEVGDLRAGDLRSRETGVGDLGRGRRQEGRRVGGNVVLFDLQS